MTCTRAEPDSNTTGYHDLQQPAAPVTGRPEVPSPSDVAAGIADGDERFLSGMPATWEPGAPVPVRSAYRDRGRGRESSIPRLSLARAWEGTCKHPISKNFRLQISQFALLHRAP